MKRKILLTLLLCAAACSVYAQKAPRTRVEWGVLGGVNIPNFSTNDDITSVKNKLGWQLGIVTAVNFGIFAIEPQILYVRQGLKVDPASGDELNLKSSSIDIPVLLSLRLLNPVRIYAGPVFTVLNDCKQKSGQDLLNFGRVRPSLSYTVGVGVLLVRHMLLDVRYNGQFSGKKNVHLPDGSELGKLRSHTLCIGIGYIF